MTDRRKLAAVGVFIAGLALSSCAMESGDDAPTEAQSAAATTAAIGGSLRAAAIASQNARNFAGAVAYYNSLYQQDRNDLGAALGLARNLRFLGDVTQATRVLEDVITRFPEQPELNGEYGKVLLAQGKAADAIPVLMHAGELAPDDWQIQSALGIAYDLMGDRANAAAAYRRALAVRPDSASVLNNLALSQAMSGDVDGGITLLRRADQQVSTNAQVRQNLAMLLAVRGELAEAERLVRADLPKEMADANMAILERLATKGALPSAPELAELTAVQSLPEVETVALETLAVAPAAAPEPTEGEPADLAAAATAAADDAFASILGSEEAGVDGADTAGETEVYRVQLASVGTEAEAVAERARLATRHQGLLDSEAIEVRHVDLGSGTEVWRVYAGPFADKAAASSLCDALTARAAACLVTVGEQNP